MKEINEEKFNNFREAVIEARKRMGSMKGFDIFTTVRVNIGKALFELNPFIINLKKIEYRFKENNLMTGRLMKVNLKKAFKVEKKGDEDD